MIWIVFLSALAGIVVAGAVFYGWSLIENLLALRHSRAASGQDEGNP